MMKHETRLANVTRELARLDDAIAHRGKLGDDDAIDALMAARAWIVHERDILHTVAHRLSSDSIHPARKLTLWDRIDNTASVWRDSVWRLFHAAHTSLWLVRDADTHQAAADRRAAARIAARDNDAAPGLYGPESGDIC